MLGDRVDDVRVLVLLGRIEVVVAQAAAEAHAEQASAVRERARERVPRSLHIVLVARLRPVRIHLALRSQPIRLVIPPQTRTIHSFNNNNNKNQAQFRCFTCSRRRCVPGPRTRTEVDVWALFAAPPAAAAAAGPFDSLPSF